MRELSLGFSPCPNDTYIFNALINGHLDHDFKFDVHIQDVEKLNQLALEEKLDITKASIHAWFHVLDRYRLLSSGGAFGKGCGPLLIAKDKKSLTSGKIALPGKLTTAALLFKLAMPGDFTYEQMPFEEIIPAVADKKVDGGVIIHESRFTYQEHGLHCLLDLGEFWENQNGCLIPLGGIIISNKIDRKTQLEIQRLIKNSILLAEKEPESTSKFIRQNAQEPDERVIRNHINMFVNNYSKDLGQKGKTAVEVLYCQSVKANLLPDNCRNKEDKLFV